MENSMINVNAPASYTGEKSGLDGRLAKSNEENCLNMTVSMSSQIHLRIISGRNSLDKISDDWQIISNKIKNLKYFQTFMFYKAFINTIELNPDSIYFFVLYDNDNPLAIFPFRKVDVSIGLIDIKLLISLKDPFEMPLYDFIVQDNKSISIFKLFLDKLNEIQPEQWDMMCIMNCLDDSCISTALSNNIEFKNLCFYTNHCYYLKTNSYDDIIKNTSYNSRRQLKRYKNRLSELGTYSFLTNRSFPELGEAYLRFIDIESSGWKGIKQTSIKQNLNRNNFYNDIIHWQSKSNFCEIHELKLKDQTIASSLTITCNDTCYILKIGYNEDFKQFSPGRILLDYIIERCCSNFINEINFISNSSHLEHWKPNSYKQSNYFVFNHQLYGTSLYHCVQLFLSLKETSWFNKKYAYLLKNFLIKKLIPSEEKKIIFNCKDTNEI